MSTRLNKKPTIGFKSIKKGDTENRTMRLTLEENEFVEQAPVSKDTLVEVVNYMADYNEAATENLRTVAEREFLADGDLDRVEIDYPYFLEDSLTLTAERTLDSEDNMRVVMTSEHQITALDVSKVLEKKQKLLLEALK